MIGRWVSRLLERRATEAAPVPGPLVILWSRAAIDAAGDGLPDLRNRVRAEVEKVVPEAHAWLMHGVLADPEDPERGVFLCHGEEAQDGWTILVRLGQFAPMEGLDDPDGEPMMMPRAVESPDNEVFEDRDHRAG